MFVLSSLYGRWQVLGCLNTHLQQTTAGEQRGNTDIPADCLYGKPLKVESLSSPCRNVPGVTLTKGSFPFTQRLGADEGFVTGPAGL